LTDRKQVYSFTLSPVLMDRVKATAKKEGRTISSVVDEKLKKAMGFDEPLSRKRKAA